MAIYLQDIVDINLNGGMIHRNFKSVSIGTGDKNANRFGMRVNRDGVPVDLTNVSCQAIFQDPQGNNIALTSYGTIDGNMAFVTLPQACYTYEGRFCLSIKLIGGGVTGTMRIVDGVIDNTHSGSTVAPTGSVPTYQEIIAQYDAMVAATQAANTCIAKNYEDVVFPVKKDTYYIRNNALLKAKQDIDEYEAYNSAHWSAVKIGTDVAGMNDKINTVNPAVIENNLLLDHPDVSRTATNVHVDGSVRNGIVLTGVNKSASNVRLFGDDSTVKLKAGKTYKYYARHTGDDDMEAGTFQLTLRLTSDLSTNRYMTQLDEGTMFSVLEDVEVVPFVRISANYDPDGVVMWPVLVEYSPDIMEYIDDAAKKKAPNLLKKEFMAVSSTRGNVVATNNHDGTMTIDGTNDGNSAISINITNSYGMRLEAGHTYLFTSNASDPDLVTGEDTCRMDIRKISEPGTVLKYEYAFGGVYTPEDTDLYKFTYRVAAGYTLDSIVITPKVIDITGYNCGIDNSARFRVCTYNVGNFAGGESGTAQGNDQIYRGLIKAFKESDADVYLFCEWDAYWNYEQDIDSADVFRKFKPYHSEWQWSRTEKWVAQMIYSDYPFLIERHAFFDDGHARHYVDDVVLIKGHPVHFISTHMHARDLQSRYDDYDKLFAFLSNNGYDYFVIGGDFNHGFGGSGTMLETARDEIDYIEEKGAASTQGGFYGALANDGFFNTYSSGNDVDDVRPYDNIIVSPNIRIRNARVIESDASDHYALCVDLEII